MFLPLTIFKTKERHQTECGFMFNSYNYLFILQDFMFSAGKQHCLELKTSKEKEMNKE